MVEEQFQLARNGGAISALRVFGNSFLESRKIRIVVIVKVERQGQPLVKGGEIFNALFDTDRGENFHIVQIDEAKLVGLRRIKKVGQVKIGVKDTPIVEAPQKFAERRANRRGDLSRLERRKTGKPFRDQSAFQQTAPPPILAVGVMWNDGDA